MLNGYGMLIGIYFMEEYTVNNEILLTKDYNKASLSIVWHRNDNKRTIVFALIELLPGEFPIPVTINEISQKISEKGYNKQSFYYQKFVDSATNILNLYKSIQDGKNIEYNKIIFEQQNYTEDINFLIYYYLIIYRLYSVTKNV